MPVATTDDTATAERTITADAIDAFAEISGDHNPIHTDETYASETMFGGRIAHGILSAGVVSAALAELPGDVIYLSQDLSFEAPVRPGDRVVATATVVEELGGDRVRVETTASVPDRDGGEEPETVLTGEAVVLSVLHESE